mgnify:CR=1 FL=1
MLEINLDSGKKLNLKNLVLDYNGTIAFDGKIIKGVKEKIFTLSKKLDIYIVTADTFGTVREEFKDDKINIEIIDDKYSGTKYKEKFIKNLGRENTIAIGNGFNDNAMLDKAKISLVIVGKEGSAVKTVLNADIIITNIIDALDLLLHNNRLKATLRR